MVARLNELKVPLAADAGVCVGQLPIAGRPHVARALVNANSAPHWTKPSNVSFTRRTIFIFGPRRAAFLRNVRRLRQ